MANIRTWLAGPMLALPIVAMTVAGHQSYYPPNYRLVRSDGLVTVLYNDRQDLTQVGLGLLRIHGDKLGRIQLAAEYVIPGRTVTRPDAVMVRFISISKRTRFAANAVLDVRCDSLSTTYSPEAYVPKNESPNGDEMVEYSIPFDDFTRLARAKSLEVDVNRIPIRVSPNTLKALRTMAEMPLN